MNDPASRLTEDADVLRSAAERLRERTPDPACAAVVPVTLASIADAVTALSRTAYAAAHALRVLSSLHEAGATLRVAAGQCGRAAQYVAATMGPVECLPPEAA